MVRNFFLLFFWRWAISTKENEQTKKEKGDKKGKKTLLSNQTPKKKKETKICLQTKCIKKKRKALIVPEDLSKL